MNEEWKDHLPEGIAISWGIEKKPKRGPKPQLSVEQITKAAIEIADEEGLAELSMSRLASLTRLYNDVLVSLYPEQRRPLLADAQDVSL